jgi:hypothetical protein
LPAGGPILAPRKSFFESAETKVLDGFLIGHWKSEISKRVDVFATALFHNMTVEGLNELDLSYTPPLSRVGSGANGHPDLVSLTCHAALGRILLLYFDGVSCLMIVDLEAEKTVDSSKCHSIVSGHSQLRATRRIHGIIGDRAFQPLHDLYSWRQRVMDKHRNGKLAFRKLYCDHRQVLADSLLASRIGGLVALYLDRSAVDQEKEMMSRFLVTETHTLVATSVYAVKIVFLTRRRLLSYCVQGRVAKY